MDTARFGSSRAGRIAVAAFICMLAVDGYCAAEGTAKRIMSFPVYSEIAAVFAENLPRMHLQGTPLGDESASRALSLYLTSLDSDHSFFLASDVEKFRKKVLELDNMLKSGDVSMAGEIASVYKERVADRVAFVKKTLTKPLQFSQGETYHWWRRGLDTPWPASKKEMDELWLKKIKDQYLRRVIAEEMGVEEEKEGVVSNVTYGPVEGLKFDGTNPATGFDLKTADTNAVVSPDQSLSNAVANTAALPVESLSNTVANTNVVQGEASSNTVASTTNQVAVPAQEKKTPEEFILKQYEQFLTVIDDNDAEWFFKQYLTAFCHAYDPHSEYMSESDTEDFEIGMKLSLGGIGALLTAEDGAAKVVNIIKGGPAEKDGRLQPGDKIVAVGEGKAEPVDVLHWPLQRIVGKIRGKKGTSVALMVIPASGVSGAALVRIELVRDEVRLEDQAASGDVRVFKGPDGVDRKMGIITLPGFYVDMQSKGILGGERRSCSEDVERILRKHVADGVDGIILDLRSNGGGSFSEVVKMTGLFITMGPVVQVKDNRGVSIIRDRESEVVYAGPLIVLINRMSASASEILAGALQDYGRAVIVGDSRTHGKGTVQSVAPLKVGADKWGSVKVTTASFYRLNGESTQATGVVADISIPSPLDIMELGEDHLDFGLPWSWIRPVDLSPTATGGNLLGDILIWGLGGPAIQQQSAQDLSPMIKILKERSELRRSKDQRFLVRQEVLKKLAERMQSKEVSLDIDKRRQQAQEEKKLYDLQKEAFDEVTTGEKPADKPADKPANDLVLEETLNILSDQVETSSPKTK